MADKKGTRRKYTLLILGEAAVLLLAAYIILCFEADAGHILPRTTVNGINLSGMTWEEAAEQLNCDAKAWCQAACVKVSFHDKFYTVAAGDAMEFDGEALAKEAMERNRWGFFAGGIAYVKALLTGYNREVFPEVKDAAAFYQVLEESGILEIDETIQTTYEKEKDRLVFTIGTQGEQVDKEELIKEVLAAVEEQNYRDVIECPVFIGSVAPVDLEQVYKESYVEPANATLDPEDHYAIVDAVTGVSFDKEDAQSRLEAAKEGERVVIDLIYTEPEIDAQDLQENLFADLLASCTTSVTGSSNRLTNIRLAVDKCEDTVLLAGDVFSFNDTVGDQNEETGFQISEGVENGKIVPAYGGGICQLSSTMFVAALYADLEIVEHWNHDLVAKYVPAGLDAAVAWGELDFRIRNNTAYPVWMESIYENGYLTVNFWGTKTTDEAVEIETETISPAGEPLEVLTYRMVYDSKKVLIREEQVAHSQYM